MFLFFILFFLFGNFFSTVFWETKNLSTHLLSTVFWGTKDLMGSFFSKIPPKRKLSFHPRQDAKGNYRNEFLSAFIENREPSLFYTDKRSTKFPRTRTYSFDNNGLEEDYEIFETPIKNRLTTNRQKRAREKWVTAVLGEAEWKRKDEWL